jgi:hypothetical protein
MGTAQEDWRLENSKGAIQMAIEGLKSLILVNGAAGTVLLGFYSSYHGPVWARHALHGALLAFGQGVLAAVLASLGAWAYQRSIARYDSDRRAAPFLVFGLAAAIASAAAFANGLYLAGSSLV